MRRMVKVDAPKDLLAAVDVPDPLEGITLAKGSYATLESLVSLGLDAVNTAAPALPGGAFFVGGLSLLTGLLLKRPGEDKRVFAEKKDSYNAGIEEGKRLVLEALPLKAERDNQHTKKHDDEQERDDRLLRRSTPPRDIRKRCERTDNDVESGHEHGEQIHYELLDTARQVTEEPERASALGSDTGRCLDDGARPLILCCFRDPRSSR